MSFDIDAILKDMANAIKDVVKDDWENVSGYAKQILQNEKEALKELAEDRISGAITDEELKSEMEAEKTTIEAELKAVQVMAKAMAERAANAALDVFYKAIKAAIGL
jgi:gas vesicle protein